MPFSQDGEIIHLGEALAKTESPLAKQYKPRIGDANGRRDKTTTPTDSDSEHINSAAIDSLCIYS
ncbi:MAG: hypothetical protein WCP34_16890, partial [Pseudomonadota bacterium]